MAPDAVVLDGLRLGLGGLLIGLAVAAPIGAVNLICIRRTLAFGPLNGFLSGLGAAAGDGVFAIVVAFGISAVADLVMAHEAALKLAGGLFLIGLAARTYVSDPARTETGRGARALADGTGDLPHTIASTFFLTVTNPATLLAFTAIIAGMAGDLGFGHDPPSATLLATSVTAGSALWWFLLTLVVGRLHGQISLTWLRRINRISAALIGLIGVAVLLSLAWPL